MSLRIRENIQGHNAAAEEYVREMTELTGEYIDQFTTVPDYRHTKLPSLVPKCCAAAPPALTMKELAEKYKLKPAAKKDTSRARQQHREQI